MTRILTGPTYLRNLLRREVDESGAEHRAELYEGLDGIAYQVQRAALVLACTIGAAACLVAAAVFFG